MGERGREGGKGGGPRGKLDTDGAQSLGALKICKNLSGHYYVVTLIAKSGAIIQVTRCIIATLQMTSQWHPMKSFQSKCHGK